MESTTEIERRDRVEREREAHTDRDVLAESIRVKDRFAHIWSFPSRIRFYAQIDSYLDDLEGKRVLDYGCGRGESSLKYLAKGAHVTGIDISAPYIEDAGRRALEAGFSDDRCSFRVMDAHQLDLEPASFDIVVGFGILHHLDAGIALDEIYRVLKPNGRVLLQEPLADNPLLKIFRLLTPNARTDDEQPFSGKEVRRLSEQHRWKTDMVYCGLLEAPLAMMTSILMPKKPDNIILRGADVVERWTHKKGVLLNWNQYVLFNMTKVSGRDT